MTKQKIHKLSGNLRVASCKSTSHRSILITSLATGKSEISNLLESEDVLNTVNILRDLGIQIKKEDKKWIVSGNGINGFMQPKKALNCGNSGTTARLIIGAVSTNPITCTFTGDPSLSKREMRRITDYLEKLGCDIVLTNKKYLPLIIKGSHMPLPLTHKINKPSAQIKSALMLAALNIPGKTTIIEPRPTRNHTELMLKYLNVKFKSQKLVSGGTKFIFNGPYEIRPRNLSIPSDPSSCAFLIVGALITPNSKIKLLDVGLNETRITYLSILKKMGGKIKIKETKVRSGEKRGTIEVLSSSLKGISIPAKLSPFLIDEYPILAVCASQAKGISYFKGLEELRHKESDRINSIVGMLKSFGIKTETKDNDIKIYGSQSKEVICKKTIKVYQDHRIGLSASVLGLISKNTVKLDDGGKSINTSYPNFKKDLNKLISN